MSTFSRISFRRPEASLSIRRALVQVHLWTGLVLCTPFVLLGLTGSILVFHHELNDLLTPPFHASTGDALRPAGEVLNAARGAAPAFSPPSARRRPSSACSERSGAS